jgi:hypothetical protein
MTLVLFAGGLVACTAEIGELRIDSVRSAQTETPATGFDVQRARIAVSEIEIEGGTEKEEREASMGDGVIEVALGGDPTTVAVDSVEAGPYHTLGIEIKHITVDGTKDGKPFKFESNLKKEIEFRIEPEVDVPAKGTATVGLKFRVSEWFTDASGKILDPSDAGNQGAIESAILASMAADGEIEDEGNETD